MLKRREEVGRLRRREEKRSIGCDTQGSVLTAEEKRRESRDGRAESRREERVAMGEFVFGKRESQGELSGREDNGRDEMSEGKRKRKFTNGPSTFYIFTLFLFYLKLKMN